MKRLLLLFFAVFLLFPISALAISYPDYTGYVSDFAHILTPGYISTLNAKLSTFDHRTTNQIAVVTIDTTEPETIEQYSINLADKWKVGQKGKDNGIIMLFAIRDRRMRIEVGRGLEGDLTDVQSKHIQNDLIVPAFRQGNYEVGITNGVNEVVTTITHGTIDPNSLNSLTSRPAHNATYSSISEFLPILVFFIVSILLIAFSPKTKLGGRGTWGITTLWGERNDSRGNSGGTDGFGGGSFSGGGSSDNW